jgi:hypothetical protein
VSKKKQEFPHRAVITSGWGGETKDVSVRLTKTQLVTESGLRFMLRSGDEIGGYLRRHVVFRHERTDQVVRDARDKAEADAEAKREAEQQRWVDMDKRRRDAQERERRDRRESLAKRIVQAIEKDLEGRLGFGSVWDACADETREEIRAEWRELAVRELEL